jgi:hypothetical protein
MQVASALPRLAFAVAVFACAASGCNGGRYPVTGKVNYADGSPMSEGMVICEMRDGEKIIQARGNLESDGSFSLGTDSPGDGVLPGKYRVLVVGRQLSEREAETMLPFIDSKFTSYETSGIELEVKNAQTELNITVTKPTR